jgi:hypothetical protein
MICAAATRAAAQIAGRVCLRHPAGANISEDQSDVQSSVFYIGACL